MAKAGRGDDQYMVRFPPGLRDKVKEAADAAGRSMNSEIIDRLEDSFADRLPTSWSDMFSSLLKENRRLLDQSAVLQNTQTGLLEFMQSKCVSSEADKVELERLMRAPAPAAKD